MELDETQANSLQKKLQKEESEETAAYKVGEVLGMFMFYIVLVGIVILVIWLLLRKRKKKEPIKETKKSNPVKLVHNFVTCQNCGAENKITSKYCIKCGYKL